MYRTNHKLYSICIQVKHDSHTSNLGMPLRTTWEKNWSNTYKRHLQDWQRYLSLVQPHHLSKLLVILILMTILLSSLCSKTPQNIRSYRWKVYKSITVTILPNIYPTIPLFYHAHESILCTSLYSALQMSGRVVFRWQTAESRYCMMTQMYKDYKKSQTVP